MSELEGRDATGRMLPGYTMPRRGRPRGYDFRRIVMERCQREGVDIEEVIWSVFKDLVRESKAGVIRASEFLVERLCGPADYGKRITIELDGDESDRVGPILPGDPRTYAQRCADVVRELKLLK